MNSIIKELYLSILRMDERWCNVQPSTRGIYIGTVRKKQHWYFGSEDEWIDEPYTILLPYKSDEHKS